MRPGPSGPVLNYMEPGPSGPVFNYMGPGPVSPYMGPHPVVLSLTTWDLVMWSCL